MLEVERYMTYMKYPLTLIILTIAGLFILGCSTSENTMSSPDGTKTSPDSFASALNLDRGNTGSGAINLAARLHEIEILLAAYRAVLDGTSEGESRNAKQRIEELEFEKCLVEALRKTFTSLQYDEARSYDKRTDYKFIQTQLKAAYTEAGFFEPLSGDIEPQFQRLIDPSCLSQPDLVREPEDLYDSDAWIIVALHVDPAKTPDWFRQDVFEAETLAEYELTHQFLALLLQRYYWHESQFNADHEMKIGELAALIAEEQEAGVDFNNLDLYSERVAVLIAGGYSCLVEREWIEKILENRLPNGLWTEFNGDESPHMHSTHVSLWAIAGYQVLMQRGEEGRQELFPFNP